MKRPSFQFYPADWRNNAKLRRCSWEARGAWLEIMCLMHDSEEYGLLRWPLKEIAQAIGAPIKLLNELVTKDVIKGGDKQHAALVYTPRSGRKDGNAVTLITAGSGSLWYSSRMVIDEYVRQKRGNLSLYKDSPNYAPMPPIGDVIGDAPMPPFSDLPTPTSTSTSKNSKHIPQTEVAPSAGEVCALLRNLGITRVNPSHVKLQAALSKGATLQDFTLAAQAAHDANATNPFAYVLGTVEGRQRNGDNHVTATSRNASILNEALPGREPEPPTFDVQARIVKDTNS